MIADTKDIYGRAVRAEAHAHLNDEVTLGLRTDASVTAVMRTSDAVALLRAMLREIEGPSVDDLSCLFDVPRSYIDVVRASNGSDVVVSIGLYTYTAPTRREAMQAAWDAGVEMYGANDAGVKRKGGGR